MWVWTFCLPVQQVTWPLVWSLTAPTYHIWYSSNWNGSHGLWYGVDASDPLCTELIAPSPLTTHSPIPINAIQNILSTQSVRPLVTDLTWLYKLCKFICPPGCRKQTACLWLLVIYLVEHSSQFASGGILKVATGTRVINLLLSKTSGSLTSFETFISNFLKFDFPNF